MRSVTLFTLMISLLFVTACNSSVKSQEKHPVLKEETKYVPVSQELYNEIQHMDSVMFDALNQRDIDKLMSTFSEDLEFYHDLGGVTDYTQTKANFEKLFENNRNTGLKRELINGTLEVYPIKDFGAIATGKHRFCHWENGKLDCGTFQFAHTWQKKDGEWKVTRVLSYGH